MTTNLAGEIRREYSKENPAKDDSYICQVGVRRDCIVGTLGKCNEASDKETGNAMKQVVRRQVHKCIWSCISRVGVGVADSELHGHGWSCLRVGVRVRVGVGVGVGVRNGWSPYITPPLGSRVHHG